MILPLYFYIKVKSPLCWQYYAEFSKTNCHFITLDVRLFNNTIITNTTTTTNNNNNNVFPLSSWTCTALQFKLWARMLPGFVLYFINTKLWPNHFTFLESKRLVLRPCIPDETSVKQSLNSNNNDKNNNNNNNEIYVYIYIHIYII